MSDSTLARRPVARPTPGSPPTGPGPSADTCPPRATGLARLAGRIRRPFLAATAAVATLAGGASPAQPAPASASGRPTPVPAADATPSTSPSNPARLDWVAIDPPAGHPLPRFRIARTETTIAQFRRFVTATGLRTEAERRGGGEVYEAGWTRKPGWTWATPFGRPPTADDEPAVHVTWGEAQAFCRWAGGALPGDAQWGLAAYTETRARPPAPFATGITYPYPTGPSPVGAQCLDDCGPEAATRAVRHGASLTRGLGHARAGTTPAGVNGLHDMGGNAWEWVDAPAGGQARTRGGSWWYGAGPMRDDHHQAKPLDTAVVYIGFRCAAPG